MAAPTVLDIQAAELDIVNTSTETNLLLYTVPANTLGTTSALRVLIRGDYLNNSVATKSMIVKIIYGTTTIWDDTTKALAVSATRYPVTIDFILFPKNATDSQGVAGNIFIGTTGGATTGIGDLATDEINADTPLVGANASEDSTAAKDLKVTITHSAINVAVSMRRLYSLIEKM